MGRWGTHTERSLAGQFGVTAGPGGRPGRIPKVSMWG